MRERALLKRTDTKFALPAGDLFLVLRDMRNHYAVVVAGQVRAADYRTLYFDSEEQLFLAEHCRGRRPRFKVRVRHYVDRKRSYLEVKEKTPSNQTVKSRRERAFMNTELNDEDLRFVDAHNPVRAESLRPTLWTNFKRITLAGIDVRERITLDFDLRFQRDDAEVSTGEWLIAEVKQATFTPRSPGFLALRNRRARLVNFSKYCTGASMLIDHPRQKHYLARLHELKGTSHA